MSATSVSREPAPGASPAPGQGGRAEPGPARRSSGAPMLRFVVRRLMLFVPTLLGASLLTFMLVKIIPGGPAYARLGEDATPESIAIVNAQLGLDQPLATQYFSWLGRMLRGDMGDSFQTGQPVSDLIKNSMPLTVQLVIMALIGTIVIAVPIGVVVAKRRGTGTARSIRTVSGIGLALPDFFVALILINIFAVWLAWFPRLGAPPLRDDPVGNLRHMILPVVPKVLGASAIVIRQVGSAMGDALDSDHTRTARAMGLTERTVIWRYAFRSALPTVLNVYALLALGLLGSTLILEQIFVLPGMGRALVNAIAVRDYTLIQGIVFVFVLIALVINLLVDLFVGVIDPARREK